MSNEFAIVERAIGPVIEIEERVAQWRMPATFARDYRRIADYLAQQGAECVGMPYARYVEMDWAAELGRGRLATLIGMVTRRWHFYAGMPASKRLAGAGPLQARELTARRYVCALHRGPYRNCGATYRALYHWSMEQGLALQNEAIECYRNDPREVGQAAAETEILLPLR